MTQPTRTEAIKRFLTLSTHPDLASLYNHDMEVQVNVARDNGTRIDGDFKGRQWHAWTDGVQTWKPIRIPYNANSEPTYDDKPMTYDISAHAEGIGMTGWDWKQKLSRWVAFDFDSLIGHSEKHTRKLTDVELLRVQEIVREVPWVTLRKSTGGKGLHLYVFLDPVPTENHNEHAALARAILGKLSGLVGYDFAAKVDTCGGNMWVWHRKMKGTDGLVILKSGEILDTIPTNWRDHVKVVSGRRKRNLPKFIEDQEGNNREIVDVFDELTSQRIRVPLDEDHKKLILWLEQNYPNAAWWDTDHHMLVTHTALLKEAHTDLAMKGPFETNAHGSERGIDINVFGFPMRSGAWALRRYTPGVQEHEYWEQDGGGWTRCFYNREPDLESAARVCSGLEDPSGGFWFETGEQAQKAALMLGANLDLKNWLLGRKTKLKRHKDGRLIAEVEYVAGKDPAMPDWLASKSKMTKMFKIKNAGENEPEVLIYDDEVRHLITEGGDDCGWVIKGDEGWHSEPYQHVKTYLQSRGFGPKEVANVMGNSIARCWRLVNRPFMPEYLADRQWNRGAAQFRFTPTVDRDNLSYPTWLKVLNHIGAGLNDAVQRSAWCKSNGILSGADYLKCWIACLFQMPTEPLPYLFLYGPQDSGKSILHESLAQLVTCGVVRADNALTSQGNFNGELEHAVLCVVEETDLRKNQQAYNRIKDWVTSRHLPIHKKQRQPYSIPNTTHWIQCANSHLFCPVLPGDTRITMSYVGELGEKIPKAVLIPMLEKEAPDFMAEILNLEIPQSNDRLALPVLATEEKMAAEEGNKTFLELFIEEKCHPVVGEMIKFSEFCDRFHEWLDPNMVDRWSKIRIGRDLPPIFPKGRSPETSQFWIGNIAWEKVASTKPKLVLKDGKLVPMPNGGF